MRGLQRAVGSAPEVATATLSDALRGPAAASP